MIRRRSNKVKMLKDDNDDWVDDQQKLKAMAVDFYKCLYKPVDSVDALRVSGCFPELSEEVLKSFDAAVTDQEIHDAVFSIGDFKAPGIDGLNGLFFHSQWEVVKDSVISFVKEVFDNPARIESVNQTMIVMVPKVDNPVIVKQFRPISLCNVIYKVVSKILANRLKWVMSDLIAPNQSSFVKGRHGNDNVIVAQEIIQIMRKNKSKKGIVAVKVDLEKAYDRIDWRFLKDTLSDVGLPEKYVELVIACMTKGEMKVMWNGGLTDSFMPSRGIR